MNKCFSTLAVHAGEDRHKPYGALTTPVVQTSTYTFENTAAVLDLMQSKAARQAGAEVEVRNEYGRYSNPTGRAAEKKLAALEGSGVESIVQQQALFVSLDPTERHAAGISDNLVRYAVGIEDPQDLVADLAQALDGI